LFTLRWPPNSKPTRVRSYDKGRSPSFHSLRNCTGLCGGGLARSRHMLSLCNLWVLCALVC